MKKNLIVTGSCGLVGSQISYDFSKKYKIIGIDNNQRKNFFGFEGDTTKQKKNLLKIKNYKHYSVDIRNSKKIEILVKKYKPVGIIHAAAQPSHDYAAKIVKENFDININGTINLLEAIRKFSKGTIFVNFSTNKVYGDLPNKLKISEKKFRYDFKDKKFSEGINETFSIDQSLHSLFGASKVSSDIITQEYGRYFKIASCSLRAGCLTGENHSSVQLHGFLNYIIKIGALNKTYNIFGYKGKQVRDNIHSEDVSSFVKEFLENPRYGEVYNLGGGKQNSISILESIKKIEGLTEKKFKFKYLNQPRIGDHICYYSDLTKIHKHFPKWKIKNSLDDIFNRIFKNL